MLDVSSFVAYILCEALGEETNKRLKEVFEKYAREASKDFKDFVVTVAYLMEAYDAEKKRLKRKIRCIDFGEILGTESEEVEASLIDEVIRTRECYAIRMFYEVLDEKKLVETIMNILSKLSPNELISLLGNIEKYRKTLPTIKDFSCIGTKEGIMLGLVLSSKHLAERLEKVKKATPMMYVYASVRAFLEGYKDVKLERIEREDNVLKVYFSYA